MAGAIAFHVALVAFSRWYLLWSVPMLGLLVRVGQESKGGAA